MYILWKIKMYNPSEYDTVSMEVFTHGCNINYSAKNSQDERF